MSNSNLTLDNFLDLLFAQEEVTCFTDSPRGTRVSAYPAVRDTFFCINALHPNMDLRPELEYHSPDRPRRADHNVVTYRNLLIELDNMPLSEQIQYVTSRVPVSAITYSGGKSYHFIISLEQPLENKEQYRQLFLRLQAALPQIDSSCKNPSRLSRLPTAIRPDTNKEQTLVQLNGRIALQTLDSMLPLVQQAKKEERKVEPSYISANLAYAISNPAKAMQDMEMQSRNRFFFWLYNRFCDLGLDMDARQRLAETAYSNLNDTNDFSLQEAYSAARIK